HGFDALRGPPSDFQQLSKLIERMREGADLDDALGHARAPAPPPPAPATATRRGRPPYDYWPRIEALDDEFCRTYFANHNRAPTWKERHTALENKLGKTTPHLKTL